MFSWPTAFVSNADRDAAAGGPWGLLSPISVCVWTSDGHVLQNS